MPEIVIEKVAVGEAFARWRTHRDRFAETGRWPVLVPSEAIDRIEDSVARQAPATEADLAKARSLDAPAMFAEILADRRKNYEKDYEADDEYEGPDFDFDPADLVRPEWPSVEAQVLTRLQYESDEFGLALVPCRAPWELPAILGWTGGDLYPPSVEHVAALREWHARHGAEPLVMGGDTVELLVRPIENPEEAKRVAIEHYAHCEDLGNSGVDSISEVATSLLGASVWTFWWD